MRSNAARIAAAVSLALLCACHSSDDPPPAPVDPLSGLDARPSNTSCLAPARNPGAGATVALQRVFPALSFAAPLAMLQAPGDDSRWFVLEKNTGRVRVFANTSNVSTSSVFVDLDVLRPAFNANGEGGLLGMAFHPQFATNGRVYLSWTEGNPLISVSVIARFTTVAGGATLDPQTYSEVIRVNQDAENHNGGNLAFGPDGRLYIGFGDGGGGGDPLNRAQDTRNLLGAMLRLDVDSATPYAIPGGANGNPFSANPMCPANHTSALSCPEIFAWGLRNPWRWSFDSGTGDLWLGDVGQGAFEEIDRVQRGGNYGWDCREGAALYDGPRSPMCPAPSMIDPVHQYDRSLGVSVTGGYVYRGTALPALAGAYVFGDFSSGRIWRLVPNGAGGFTSELLLNSGRSISSFGQGNDGELYVVDFNGGLYKIVDGGGQAAGPPVATQLSATGCVNAQSPAVAANGLVPYDVAAPFWSDAAAKEHWLALPNGTAIGVAADGDFALPTGSVLMKHFRLNGALVETRLLMRHPDGEWAGYSYEWNAARTDATLVQGGKTGPQGWIFPSGNDCMMCHTAAAGFALGLETAQLNNDFTYAATGRTANQLRTLSAIGMFATPIGEPSAHPALPDPFDAAAPLAARARAYLHTNCAHCHRPGGPTQSSMDLRYATPLSSAGICGALPQSGDLGLGAAARIVAPGSTANSVLLARMNRRDAVAMPPLASSVVDAEGVALIGSWIASLNTCN